MLSSGNGEVLRRIYKTAYCGADYSLDNGKTWTILDTFENWSVAFSKQCGVCAVGPSGRITEIVFR